MTRDASGVIEKKVGAEEKTEQCCCGHEHHDECCCGHEHHDHEGECCCGHDHHEHHHDHCGCGCEGGHEDHHDEDRHVLSAKPSLSYHVLNVDCPNCALGTQNAVMALPLVADAKLTYVNATLDVVLERGADHDEALRQVLECVRSRGQDLELSESEVERLSAERSWFQENREKVLMGISGFALAAGLVLDHAFGLESRAIPFSVVAALAGLVFVAPMA